MLYTLPTHWYALVLYKRFLTPFRNGIWNRRQVSVGDRGGPSHTTQKSSGIGPPGTPNELVCDRARHRNRKVSVRMYISHGESQKNISVRMYITHSQSKEYVSVLMYIPHSQSRENVSVRMYIPHSFMCRLVCERCNYHTRSALVNCLLLSTISHTI